MYATTCRACDIHVKCSGACNAIGMELYPRIGKSFDLKTWTNCRMGMMGWAFWILCFAVKQYQTFGHVSKAMLVSVLLMEIYIFKFFL